MKIQTKIAQANFSILLACFIMATIAWGTVFYGHSVYLDAFTRLGSWKIQQITTAILIFWFSSLPGTLSIGYLIDSKGPCSMVVLGALFIGLALIGLGQATELWQIFMCYALMGFAYPAIGAAGISATLAPHFSKNFGLALGIALTGASLGGAVIPLSLIHILTLPTTPYV